MPSRRNIQRLCGTIQVIASVETYAHINSESGGGLRQAIELASIRRAATI